MSPLRNQLVQEINEADTDLKEMLQSLLKMHDLGLVDLTLEEESGHVIYQASEKGLTAAEELGMIIERPN